MRFVSSLILISLLTSVSLASANDAREGIIVPGDAQTTIQPVNPPPPPPPRTVSTQPVLPTAPNPAGWGWAVAATFSGNYIGATRVFDPDDVVINSAGNVHLLREINVQPAFTIETHQTYTLPWFGRRIAMGPYVNVVPGDNLFTAAGTGIAFELMSEQKFNALTNRFEQGPSMMLGIGALVYFDVTVLADGVFPGEPPEFGDEFLTTETHTTSFQMWIGVGF